MGRRRQGGETEFTEDQCGLYLLWELHFQVKLLTPPAEAPGKWWLPIVAAEKHGVYKTELVIRKAKAAGALGNHRGQPSCFSNRETEAQRKVRTYPGLHREIDSDKLSGNLRLNKKCHNKEDALTEHLLC